MKSENTQIEHPGNQTSRINTIFSFIFINVFRNIIGILRNKILAVTYGASSIGLLGQFLNFDGITGKIILFGSTASLVNTYHDAERLNIQKSIVILAHFILISFSGIVNLSILWLFSSEFAGLIYLDRQYVNLIYIGIGLNIIYAASTFLELILQAGQQFKDLFKARIAGLVVGIVTLYPLLINWNIEGVIINMIILYAVSFTFLIYKLGIFTRLRVVLFLESIQKLKISIFRLIFKVMFTDLSRSLIVYGSLLIVRIIVIQALGEGDAGYYHACLSISNYLNIILEGFIVYFYPVICAAQSDKDIMTETNLNFEILFYLVFPVIILIELFPAQLIQLLYSGDFVHISFLLALLICTKILYLYYYFFTISFLAKSFLKKFLLIESVRSILLISSTYICMIFWQFSGAIYALVVTEILSFIVVWALKRKLTKFAINSDNRKNILYIVLISIFILANPFDKLYMVIAVIVMTVLLFDMRKYLLVMNIVRSFLKR